MTATVTVQRIKRLTPDVVEIRTDRPDGFEFEAGQACDVALDLQDWREETRPFTFTSLKDADHLEFVIKIYDDHDGVTKRIGNLKEGDRLLVGEPWGAIRYKGRGVFIAGGAGITPFVAILRQLRETGDLEGNKLIFSNKTEADIILRGEFEGMHGLDCLFTVTDQPESTQARGMIDREFLEKHVGEFNQTFYVCGPPPMMESVIDSLSALGAKTESVVLED